MGRHQRLEGLQVKEVAIWVPQSIEMALPAAVQAVQAVAGPSIPRSFVGVMFHEYRQAPGKDAFEDDFDAISGQAVRSAMTDLLRELPIAALARYQPGRLAVGPATFLTVRYGRLSGWARQDERGYPCMTLEPRFYVDGDVLRGALNFANDLNELRYLELNGARA